MKKSIVIASLFLLSTATSAQQAQPVQAPSLTSPQAFVNAVNEASKGNYAPMWTYINRGGSPNTLEAQGIGFLQVTVARMDLEETKKLLSIKADPNVQNIMGLSPLHWASLPYPGPVADVSAHQWYDSWIKNSPALVEALLNAGGDPNLKTNIGATPLHAATNFFGAREDLARLGIQPAKGAVRKRAIKYVADTAAGAAFLVGLGGAAIGAPTGVGAPIGAGIGAVIGFTSGAALGAAAASASIIESREKKVDFLLAKGAHVNAIDNFGNTPLHYLVASKKDTEAAIPIAKKLVKAGANLDLRNKQGKTAWDIAKENHRIFIMPIIKPKSQRVLPWRK